MPEIKYFDSAVQPSVDVATSSVSRAAAVTKAKTYYLADKAAQLMVVVAAAAF